MKHHERLTDLALFPAALDEKDPNEHEAMPISKSLGPRSRAEEVKAQVGVQVDEEMKKQKDGDHLLQKNQHRRNELRRTVTALMLVKRSMRAKKASSCWVAVLSMIGSTVLRKFVLRSETVRDMKGRVCEANGTPIASQELFLASVEEPLADTMTLQSVRAMVGPLKRPEEQLELFLIAADGKWHHACTCIIIVMANHQ